MEKALNGAGNSGITGRPKEQLNVAIIGRPNCGKGTFMEWLKANYPGLWTHYSTGDDLREHRKNKTQLGLKAQSYIDDGAMVPSSLINEMVEKRRATIDGNVVLDGWPRVLDQVDFARETPGLHISAIIYVDVPREQCLKRSTDRRYCPKCGKTYTIPGGFNPPKMDGVCDSCGTNLEIRKDDLPEVAENRQCVYDNETAPALEKMRNEGIPIYTIDNSNGTTGALEMFAATLSEILAKHEDNRA